MPVDEIVRAVGTPVHVYDAGTIAARYRALDQAFAAYPHRLHYAIKSNATRAIVSLLHGLGAGADANSGGEIDLALRAGFAPADIVFTGVGKTRTELERAIALGVRALNVESPGELARVNAIATTLGTVARVALRINPDVDAESHPHISTGLAVTKFGMTPDEARQMARQTAAQPGLQLVGLHVHVGSQVTRAEPIRRAAESVTSLAEELLAIGIPLEHVDLGGGLGIAYRPGDRVLSVEDYADAILPVVSRVGLPLVLEPGRWLVGPAGTLITEVVDLKHRPDGKWFVIVDAGMTDLMRPALYGAWHSILALRPRSGSPIHADVVGPVCETTDTLGTDRVLPPIEVGDLLAICDTGAYGSVMASNYNRRPMAAEVLVEDESWRVIRRRQTIDDMMQWDE